MALSLVPSQSKFNTNDHDNNYYYNNNNSPSDGSSTSSLPILPKDIYGVIIDFIYPIYPPSCYPVAALVCKEWKQIVDSKWRQVFGLKNNFCKLQQQIIVHRKGLILIDLISLF